MIPSEPASRLPRILQPLRHRDFRLMWAGQSISMLGNFVYSVALPFQILALGGDVLQLGIGIAIGTSVELALTLFGGAVVDRLPRRRVMLLSDLGSGVVVSAIAALGALGLLRIEHIYVAAALFGLVHAFFFPASQAIVPELIPQDVLVAGNAARGLSRQGARVAGPVLGGLLVVTLGPPAAFAFDAATFFASFIFLVAMTASPAPPRSSKRLLAEVREGLAFVFSLPWLWITIFGFALVNAAIFGAMGVALPILVTQTLGLGAGTYGFLTACVGAGEAVGGVVVAQLRVKRAGLTMYLFATLSGLAVLGYGFTTSVPAMALLSALLGAGFVGFGVQWDSALQRHVPRELLGRVSSVDFFGAILLGPVTPLGAAALVQASGPSTAFVLGGAVATALCLGALLVPSIRRLE